MKTNPAPADKILRPEVLAVIRSAFDGYNEPEALKAPVKTTPAKFPSARVD